MISDELMESRTSKVLSTLCHLCQKETDYHGVLECGHHVCSYCLPRTSTAPCPVCKVQENQSNLRRLYMALLKKHNGFFKPEKSETDKESFCCICHIRKVKVPATHQCLDCSDTLCQTCSNGHNASSVTHAHKVVRISDVCNGTHCIRARTPWFQCPEHVQEQYVFFCETCNRLICTLCFMKEHRTHSVETMSDTAIKFRDIMSTSRLKLKETFAETETNTLLQELDKRSKEINTKKGTLLHDIHAKCESLVNRILAQENEATSRVVNFYDSHLRDIEFSEEQARESSEIATQFLPLLETIQADEDCVRFLMLFEDVKNVLRQLTMVESEMKRSLDTPRDELHLEVSDTPMASPFFIKETGTVFLTTNDEVMNVSDSSGTGVSETGTSHAARESKVSTNDSRVDMKTPVCGTKDQESGNSLDMRNPVIDNADNDVESAIGDSFKLTESLTIVGSFAQTMQTGHISSDSHLPESINRYKSPPLMNQLDPRRGLEDSVSAGDHLNSGDDSLSQPPKLKYASWADEVDSEQQSVQADQIASKMKTSFVLRSDVRSDSSRRQIKWAKKTKINCKIPQDKVIPEIKALDAYGSKDPKIVISDHANKRIRMISGNGKHLRMCGLKHIDDIPFHSIATVGEKIAFVSGLKMCIVDKNLNRLKTIDLLNIHLSQIAVTGSDANFLPLSRFTDSSVIIGNLPNNNTRIYHVNGKLISEQPAPVSGPVIAISQNNKDQLLFSSWYPPGAVYLARKTGQVIQTFRPSDNSLWYPEGTCVDRLDNVYVAEPSQCLIQVFHPDGSIISTLSLARSLITPRCLTMTSDECLYVAGFGSGLMKYKIETKD